MAISTNRITFTYALSKTLFACRYIGGVPADPSLPYNATTNDWTQLTELAGGTVAVYYAAVRLGEYDIVEETAGPVYTTLAPYVQVHHSSADTENHINDSDADVRHDHDAIAIEATYQGRLGVDLAAALDNITGATWDKDLDDNLKEHLDDTTAAHPATAISHTIGALTDAGDILDDHETRITALETGTAATPSGIHDYTGDLGIDVEWTAQDVNDIQYAVRYLWKHTGESVPATYADLEHQYRSLTAETTVTFRSRRFDLASSVNTDLVLYYAIAAKGRADAAWDWSAVQSIAVTLPTFTQEYTGVLSGLSVCGNNSPSIYDLSSTDNYSDEDFPTATEAGGVPTANYIQMPFLLHNVTITGVEVVSGTAMSGDCTMKFDSTSGGVSTSFTVAQSSKSGSSGTVSLGVTVGDMLRVWTTDPKGISHYRIKVWFYVS